MGLRKSLARIPADLRWRRSRVRSKRTCFKAGPLRNPRSQDHGCKAARWRRPNAWRLSRAQLRKMRARGTQICRQQQEKEWLISGFRMFRTSFGFLIVIMDTQLGPVLAPCMRHMPRDLSVGFLAGVVEIVPLWLKPNRRANCVFKDCIAVGIGAQGGA